MLPISNTEVCFFRQPSTDKGGSCRNPFIQNSLEVTIDELLLNHNLLLLLLLSEFLFAFAAGVFVNWCMKTGMLQEDNGNTPYTKWKQAKQGKFTAVK